MIFGGWRSKSQPKSTFSVSKSIKNIPISQKPTSLHSSEGGKCWFSALQKMSDFGVFFSERPASSVAENMKKIEIGEKKIEKRKFRVWIVKIPKI